MNGTPLVSVIMPNHNGARFIEKSIDSALRQSMPDLELLIVDDASTDESPSLLEAALRRDSRAALLRCGQCVGAAQARNLAIERARGEFLAFLDSDDLWHREKLARQLSAIREDDFCYTSYFLLRRDGISRGIYRVPPRADYRSLLRENVIGCSSVLLRRTALGHHRMDSRFFHEDYVLWLTLLREGKTAVGIPEPLMGYRAGGRSQDKLSAAAERWRIYRESEGMSVPAALGCLSAYACRGIRKYWTRREP